MPRSGRRTRVLPHQCRCRRRRRWRCCWCRQPQIRAISRWLDYRCSAPRDGGVMLRWCKASSHQHRALCRLAVHRFLNACGVASHASSAYVTLWHKLSRRSIAVAAARLTSCRRARQRSSVTSALRRWQTTPCTHIWRKFPLFWIRLAPNQNQLAK